MTFDKKDTGTGITKRVFCVFLAVSFFALAYINLTGSENIRLVSEQFPELNLSFRKAFVSGYKMSMSAAIFLIDVILVGPFAWLSYFGDHITPKRFPQLRNVSFFDLGVMLATDFTLAAIAFNFTIINAVDADPVKFISPKSLWIITGILFAMWFAATIIKTYTYDADQRRDLKKYILTF